ncbi:Uncharacterised protein [Mycobacteroides abscessus subsp. abscessus]|nr:Uncharacterised protein [Mycobacteroides abscessus subsp. abscessus]
MAALAANKADSAVTAISDLSPRTGQRWGKDIVKVPVRTIVMTTQVVRTTGSTVVSNVAISNSALDIRPI